MKTHDCQDCRDFWDDDYSNAPHIGNDYDDDDRYDNVYSESTDPDDDDEQED